MTRCSMLDKPLLNFDVEDGDPLMPKTHYWFPARSNGWGWGLPTTWQGWLVYGTALTLIVATFLVFPPAQAPLAFAALHAGVCLLVVAACALKGERPA
jgi:lipoprotein signal peptidase